MILKWLSQEGHWHWKDNAIDVINMGWMTVPAARAIAQRRDGPEAYILWQLDSTNLEVENDEKEFHFVIAVIDGERLNMIFNDSVFYVLSDEGKTIDKL